jgi:hypothetical protein
MFTEEYNFGRVIIVADRLRGVRLRDSLYLQKLALTSPTSRARSADIVRSRTKATVFLMYLLTN